MSRLDTEQGQRLLAGLSNLVGKAQQAMVGAVYSKYPVASVDPAQALEDLEAAYCEFVLMCRDTVTHNDSEADCDEFEAQPAE